MAFYFVTGKLGNGKTLSCVGRIRDKLQAGCMIATNVNIDLVAMCGRLAKTPHIIRVPDKPTVEDLEKIGNANSSYDESKNGLLVLDECGTWFNSRNWQDKSRQAVNNWFLHARKLGWDVLLIVQDISIIDSQARDALSEFTVFCRRLDNLQIPFIGGLVKAVTGVRLKLPRVHIAKVIYGTSETDLVSDRWVYRGNDLFACYDTKQLFLTDYSHGVYSLLTPWHIKGRFQKPRDWRFYMRITKIVWKRFKSPIAFGTGALLGCAMFGSVAFGMAYRDVKVKSAKPVNVAAAALQKTEEKAAPSNGFFERLQKMRIDSSMQVNGVYLYRFRDDSNGKTPVYYTSAELLDAGVTVIPATGCKAFLSFETRGTPIYCL
ncbi:MAG: hypothetical protein JWM78_462 [Verrucomicrobiaceae bacterium]|nr:hypothetical protein [Verrucomicrobiaceae bacterium]